MKQITLNSTSSLTLNDYYYYYYYYKQAFVYFSSGEQRLPTL